MELEIKHFTDNMTKFDIVQKAANLGFWAYDHTSEKTSWSNQMFAIYGMSSDFILKQDQLFNFVHPEDRERVARQLLASQASKSEDISKYRIVRPSGEVRLVVANTSFILGDDNEIVMTIGTVQDQTENEVLQHYKSIFENNPDAVFRLT